MTFVKSALEPNLFLLAAPPSLISRPLASGDRCTSRVLHIHPRRCAIDEEILRFLVAVGITHGSTTNTIIICVSNPPIRLNLILMTVPVPIPILYKGRFQTKPIEYPLHGSKLA